MLLEANHRLTALRGLPHLLRDPDLKWFLKNVNVSIRVFIVPNALEDEFEESLEKSDNDSGSRAHWSIVQFLATAIIEKELEKRAASESSSFIDKVWISSFIAATLWLCSDGNLSPTQGRYPRWEDQVRIIQRCQRIKDDR